VELFFSTEGSGFFGAHCCCEGTTASFRRNVVLYEQRVDSSAVLLSLAIAM